jgi:hypothetical protein
MWAGRLALQSIKKMRDGGIGRILVAALHQGIADQMPSRLEFYENWFTTAGLRQGTIGLAAVVAVLSFLRREGTPYDLVSRRAGEYAAQWTVESLSPMRRRVITALPRRLRTRAALRVGRDLVRATHAESRARVRVRRGIADVDIRNSIFCGVREPSPQPLCEFYSAAIARVLVLFDVAAPTRVTACRSGGERSCHIAVGLRRELPAAGQTP